MGGLICNCFAGQDVVGVVMIFILVVLLGVCIWMTVKWH